MYTTTRAWSHIWSHLVTFGHIWSHLVTFARLPHQRAAFTMQHLPLAERVPARLKLQHTHTHNAIIFVVVDIAVAY